jgi:phage gp29-like protein
MIKRSSPRKGEIVAMRQSAYWSASVARNLTPGKLTRILNNLDSGDISDAMVLFDEMEEKDLHLGAVTQTRVLAAVSQDREITSASGSAKDKVIADFVREKFEAIPRRSALLCALMSAVTHGFAIAEIIWDVSGGVTDIVDIKPRPQKYFTFNDMNNGGSLTEFPRYLDPDVANGVELPREKFIFHRHYAGQGDCLKAGLYRGVSWYYLFTNFTIKDWLTFIDLYGIPLRLGKFQKTADDKAREVLKDAVSNLGSDAAAIISDDTTIEFIHSALSGDHTLFQSATEFFNSQKSKRMLGQTLTTESGEKGGSYALGKVHDRVRGDIVAFDSKSLDETLNFDLVRPLVDFNFGPQKIYPKIVTRFNRSDETAAKLAQVGKLVELGAKVPARVVAEITGVGLAGDLDEPLEINRRIK